MLSRILIVDPDEACHELIGRINDHSGSGPVVRLDHAYNGQGGFRLVCKARDNGQPYDQVLVAAQLPPGWNGLFTIKRIWESGSAEKLVLMGGVGYLSEAESQRYSVLEKPLQEKAVLELLMEGTSGLLEGENTAAISVESDGLDEDTVPLLMAMAMLNRELEGDLGSMLSALGQLSETNLDGHQSHLVRQILDMGFRTRGLCRDAWGLVQTEKRRLPGLRTTSMSEFLEDLRAKLAMENIQVVMDNRLGIEFPSRITCDFDRLGQVLTILIRTTAVGMKGPIIITEIQKHNECCLKYMIHDKMEKSDAHDVMRRFQLHHMSQVEENKPHWDLILAGKLVKLMKGRLWGEGHGDAGMLYYLTLGFQPEEETVVGAVKKRILLAEDNPTNIKIVKLHLAKAGYEVVVAENGRDAVHQALNSSFDLILMDLQMPDIDGFTITRMIREKERQVPIVALTANVFGDHRAQAFEAGMVDFIAKPIRRGPFLKRLEKWIGNPQNSSSQVASFNNQAEAQPITGHDDVSEGGEKVLDYERLLDEFHDDRELVKSVVKEFILNTEIQLKAILSALMGNDLDMALYQVHSLKGGGSNLCAFSFANAASQLEEACESKDANGISCALMKINREFRHLSEIVRQHEHLSL